MNTRANYLREYVRRPEVMEKNRNNSKKMAHKKALFITLKRIESYSTEDLLFILKTKCEKLNENYDEKKEEFVSLLEFLKREI